MSRNSSSIRLALGLLLVASSIAVLPHAAALGPGSIAWTQALAGKELEGSSSNRNGDLLVAVQDHIAGYPKAYAYKFDLSGNLVWQARDAYCNDNTPNPGQGSLCYPTAVAWTPTGNAVVAYTESLLGSNQQGSHVHVYVYDGTSGGAVEISQELVDSGDVNGGGSCKLVVQLQAYTVNGHDEFLAACEQKLYRLTPSGGSLISVWSFTRQVSASQFLNFQSVFVPIQPTPATGVFWDLEGDFTTTSNDNWLCAQRSLSAPSTANQYVTCDSDWKDGHTQQTFQDLLQTHPFAVPLLQSRADPGDGTSSDKGKLFNVYSRTNWNAGSDFNSLLSHRDPQVFFPSSSYTGHVFSPGTINDGVGARNPDARSYDVAADDSLLVCGALQSADSSYHTWRALGSTSGNSLTWTDHGEPGGYTFANAAISCNLDFNSGFFFAATLVQSGQDVLYIARYTGGDFSNPTPPTPPSQPLAVQTASLQAGQVGVAYSQTLQAVGGSPPYTWSVSAGQLPDGLALAGSTGVLSGTPTTAGSSLFTIQVQDSVPTTASKQFSILITQTSNPPPPGGAGTQAWTVQIGSNGDGAAGVVSPAALDTDGPGEALIGYNQFASEQKTFLTAYRLDGSRKWSVADDYCNNNIPHPGTVSTCLTYAVAWDPAQRALRGVTEDVTGDAVPDFVEVDRFSGSGSPDRSSPNLISFCEAPRSISPFINGNGINYLVSCGDALVLLGEDLAVIWSRTAIDSQSTLAPRDQTLVFWDAEPNGAGTEMLCIQRRVDTPDTILKSLDCGQSLTGSPASLFLRQQQSQTDGTRFYYPFGEPSSLRYTEYGLSDPFTQIRFNSQIVAGLSTTDGSIAPLRADQTDIDGANSVFLCGSTAQSGSSHYFPYRVLVETVGDSISFSATTTPTGFTYGAGSVFCRFDYAGGYYTLYSLQQSTTPIALLVHYSDAGIVNPPQPPTCLTCKGGGGGGGGGGSGGGILTPVDFGLSITGFADGIGMGGAVGHFFFGLILFTILIAIIGLVTKKFTQNGSFLGVVACATSVLATFFNFYLQLWPPVVVLVLAVLSAFAGSVMVRRATTA